MCRFFKGWLEVFIQERVRIERDWVIPLQSNIVLEQKEVLNISKKRPVQRKRTRKNHRT